MDLMDNDIVKTGIIPLIKSLVELVNIANIIDKARKESDLTSNEYEVIAQKLHNIDISVHASINIFGSNLICCNKYVQDILEMYQKRYTYCPHCGKQTIFYEEVKKQ